MHMLRDYSLMGENTSNDIKEESKEVAATVKKKKPKKDAFVIEIPDDLESLLKKEDFSSDVCIYKVPRKLRAINPTAYTPQLISIGPFHHNYEPLKDMENQKLRYLAEFCRRTGKIWKELLQQIKELEPYIRRCYDHAFELYNAEDTFSRMILLDSVFIIEFFLRRGECLFRMRITEGLDEKYKSDYILGKPSREHAILEDLLLLENQLPYFVLEGLYEFATKKSDFLSLVRLNLIEYLIPSEVEDHQKFISCDCFSCFYGFWVTRWFSCQKKTDDDNREEKENEENPKHLTDLVRKSRSYKHPESKELFCVKSLYSATKLHEAGVKFKVNKEAWPLDIKFEWGELKMPRFEAQDGTERLIRNLMAFEQCHHPNDPYICEYIFILDFLIDTEKDVDLLIQKGIITNLLGESKSVAKLVNKLCLEIRASGSCFYDLSVQLNRHYENPWYNSVAILRSTYFSNIWRGTGTIIALMLLFFTIIQSVYSLKRIF